MSLNNTEELENKIETDELITNFINYEEIEDRKFSMKFDEKDKQKRVTINIGGVRYETYEKTLKLIKSTRLEELNKNADYTYDPIRNEYFFDRDPHSFLAILNYYRFGQLHVPISTCGHLFSEELNYWGICDTNIQPCCWTNYINQKECANFIDYLDDQDELENKLKHEVESPSRFHIVRCYNRIKSRVWLFLVDHKSSQGAEVNLNLFLSLSLSVSLNESLKI
jgi:potassium voltage-gated channel Shaw-related subfamily C member 1